MPSMPDMGGAPTRRQRAAHSITNVEAPIPPVMPLATPERTRLSDYPVTSDADWRARLEKKLDEALEKLDRIDRRSRHLD